MTTSASNRRIKPKLALVMALLTTITGLMTSSCNDPQKTGGSTPSNTSSPAGENGQGLRLGSLFSSTGDIASIAQPLPIVAKMAVDTVNSCGGVNGAPVTLIEQR